MWFVWHDVIMCSKSRLIWFYVYPCFVFCVGFVKNTIWKTHVWNYMIWSDVITRRKSLLLFVCSFVWLVSCVRTFMERVHTKSPVWIDMIWDIRCQSSERTHYCWFFFFACFCVSVDLTSYIQQQNPCFDVAWLPDPGFGASIYLYPPEMSKRDVQNTWDHNTHSRYLSHVYVHTQGRRQT